MIVKKVAQLEHRAQHQLLLFNLVNLNLGEISLSGCRTSALNAGSFRVFFYVPLLMHVFLFLLLFSVCSSESIFAYILGFFPNIAPPVRVMVMVKIRIRVRIVVGVGVKAYLHILTFFFSPNVAPFYFD